MRDEEAPQSSGLDLKGLIQNYGPLAAAAAGILLTRGRGSADLLAKIKAVAPKHVGALEKSPFPYLFESNPLEGMIASKFGVVSPLPRTLSDSLSNRFGMWRTLGPVKQIETETGKMPTAFGHVTVGERPGMGAEDPVAVGLHELGHAAGFERGRTRFPAADPQTLAKYGNVHQDLLGLPETQKIISSELQKNPSMRDYAVNRFGYGNPASGKAGALGEVLNETWTQRMLRNAKLPAQSLDIRKLMPDFNKVSEQVGPELNYIQQHGKLLPADDAARAGALEKLLHELRMQTPYYPYLR